MAKIRIGIGSDFRLKDQKLGLGENNPQERLDVAGVAKGKDLKVTGISSLTAYEGFLRADHQIAENTTLSFDQGPSASLSGEIIVGTGQTVTVTGVGLGTTTVGNGSGTITNTIETTDVTRAGGSEIECLKVYDTFTPPSGGTNERPYAPKPGELYYNYDFKTIEFFDGYGWRQVDNTTRSGRGVFGGGANPSIDTYQAEIDFVNISTLGNAQSFGDLTLARTNLGACSSEIRGIFAAGNDGSYRDVVDYITIASQGNAIDFGNVSTTNRSYVSCCSSSTRGLFNGGYTPTPSNQTVNIIDRIEISTIGNAVDFGDLFHKVYASASTSSTTRAIIAGGVGTPDLGTNPSTRHGQIQKYEIGSGGTSIDFGQLSVSRWNVNGMSNGTRGVFGGGQVPTYFSVIDYITIASEGNSLQFGDLSTVRDGVGATSDRTRGLFAGGRETSPSPGTNGINVIEYITMASLGNPVDFGDLTVGRHRLPGLSDSHGGLGGF